MFVWRRIATYDQIHAARRALWAPDTAASSGPGTAVPTPPAWHHAPEIVWHPTPAWAATDHVDDAGQKGAAPQGSSEGPDNAGGQMAKYLSREWVAAGRERVETDPEFHSETQGIHASILCVIHNQPAHATEVLFIDFRDGQIIDLYTGDRAALDARGVQPTFEVHGDYDTFMQIQEGHLSQTTALMRGRLRLKGSLLKAMRYMRALETVTKILRSVPTEY